MDIAYLLFLQGLRESAPDFVNQLFFGISELAGSSLAVLVLMGIFWCVDKRAGYYLLLCQMGATALNQTVKNTACVYRPWVRDPRVQVAAQAAGTATGYSFPSGHTTRAVSTYGGFAVWQRRHKIFAALMVILTLLTAFSRNWLGAHTPEDVCAALVLSTAFLFAAAKAVPWLESHPERRGLVLAGGLALCAALVLYVEFKPYPLDYLPDGTLLVDPFAMKTDCFKSYGALLGLLLGWYFEQSFLRFAVAGSRAVRLVRLAVGGALALLLQLFVMPGCTALLGVNWGNFVSHALLLLYAVFLYPALFTFAERRLRR